MKSEFTTIGIALLLSSAAYSLEVSCIKTSVRSGNQCQNLMVDFNFAQCGDQAPEARQIKSVCVNQKAVAVFRAANEMYIATYAAPATSGQSWRFLTLRKEPRPGASAPGPVITQKPAVPVKQTPVKSSEISSTAVVTSDMIKRAEEVAAKMNESLKNQDFYQSQKAEVETVQAVASVPSPVASVPKVLKIGAMMDMYYTYNTNTPAAVSAGAYQPSAQNIYRAYDIYSDQLSLALAALRLQNEVADVHFIADVGFGQNVTVMNGGSGGNTSDSAQHILQAHFKIKMGSRWNFQAGKMFSHIGSESPYAMENSIYSTTLLKTFGAPISHTGFAFEWNMSPRVQTVFYMYNNLIGTYDLNNSKHFGLRWQWTKSPTFTMQYNFLTGNERVSGTGVDPIRSVHNLNFNWLANPKFGILFDSIFGTAIGAGANGNRDLGWNAYAMTLNWLRGKSTFSTRFEIYNDVDGYTVAGAYGTGTPAYNIQVLNSLSLANAWDLGEGMKIGLEARVDQSDKNVFTSTNGVANSTNSQATVTTSFTFKY